MFDAHLLENQQTIQEAINASGDIVSFNSSIERPMSDLIVNIEPVQSGSGDPSPTNIRPISGWTGANVIRTGKNLWTRGDCTFTHYYKYNYSDPIIPLPSGTYTMTADVESDDTVATTCRVAFNDSADTAITYFLMSRGEGQTYTFTLDRPCAYVYLYASNSASHASGKTATFSNIQIERASSASAFEAYNGDTYPITWSDTAGTVYGGTLDVVRGKLTKEWVAKMFRGTETLTTNSSTNPSRVYVNGTVTAPALHSAEGEICSHAKWVTAGSQTSAVESRCNAFDVGTNRVIYFCFPDYPTGATLKAYFAEQYENGTPVTIVWKVAPTEYDLDPVTIQTLLGQNNVWADCGSIESLKVDAVRGALKIELIES